MGHSAADVPVGKDGGVKQRIAEVVAWGQALGTDFTRSRASLVAGGLAYFVALSLAPVAVALGSLAGLILDPADVRSALESLAERTPGSSPSTESAIDVLVGLVETSSSSAFTVTTVVSVLLAVYASSKVVLGLRMGMNSVFGVVETRSGLIERGISAVVTLVGLVVGVALVILLTVVPRVLDWLGLATVTTTTGSWIVDWLVILALVYLAVRWLLHHAPNGGRRVPWTSPGAILAALWIVAVTGGVGVYAHYSASLGAAVLLFGTAVVILLWIYLCFLGLLWGAVIEAAAQRARQERQPDPRQELQQ